MDTIDKSSVLPMMLALSPKIFIKTPKHPKPPLLLLKKGGDETSFETSQNDSDTLWFDKQGEITQFLAHGGHWSAIINDGYILGYVDER